MAEIAASVGVDACLGERPPVQVLHPSQVLASVDGDDGDA